MTYRLPTVACYCYGYGYVYTIAYTLRLPSNHQSLPISQMLLLKPQFVLQSPTKRNNQQRQQRAPKHTGSQAPPSPQYAPLPSKQKAAPMKLLSLSGVSVSVPEPRESRVQELRVECPSGKSAVAR